MVHLLSWVSMVMSSPTPQIPGRCYLNVEKAGTVFNCACLIVQNCLSGQFDAGGGQIGHLPGRFCTKCLSLLWIPDLYCQSVGLPRLIPTRSMPIGMPFQARHGLSRSRNRPNRPTL